MKFVTRAETSFSKGSTRIFGLKSLGLPVKESRRLLFHSQLNLLAGEVASAITFVDHPNPRNALCPVSDQGTWIRPLEFKAGFCHVAHSYSSSLARGFVFLGRRGGGRVNDAKGTPQSVIDRWGGTGSNGFGHLTVNMPISVKSPSGTFQAVVDGC